MLSERFKRMPNPKDAFGTPLMVGDTVELIQDVVSEGQTLPKGTILRGLRYWLNDTQVEFHQVDREPVIIPIKHLKKRP